MLWPGVTDPGVEALESDRMWLLRLGVSKRPVLLGMCFSSAFGDRLQVGCRSCDGASGPETSEDLLAWQQAGHIVIIKAVLLKDFIYSCREYICLLPKPGVASPLIFFNLLAHVPRKSFLHKLSKLQSIWCVMTISGVDFEQTALLSLLCLVALNRWTMKVWNCFKETKWTH